MIQLIGVFWMVSWFVHILGLFLITFVEPAMDLVLLYFDNLLSQFSWWQLLVTTMMFNYITPSKCYGFLCKFSLDCKSVLVKVFSLVESTFSYHQECRKPKAWLIQSQRSMVSLRRDWSITAQYGNDPITDWVLRGASGLQEDSTSWMQSIV